MSGVVQANSVEEPSNASRPNPDLLSQPLTDSGNGERFVKLHGQDVRYCPEYKAWFVWDKKRWKRERNGRVHRMAKETARRLYVAALALPDSKKEERKRIESHARDSEGVREIKAMLECARNEIGISIPATDFDTDPWLLNCKNGTLDLQKGELRPHSRDDLITKLCAVRFDENATCPRFASFLKRIFNGNPDLIAYVGRIVGCALTGIVREKALFVCFGGGDNGKTTLLEVVRYVLGDYAGQIMIESLLHSGNSRQSAALADLADLRGKRFVTTSEAEQGSHLAEALVKQLTGMGQIKTCRKYENPVEFPPTFKIFMDSNYKPRVRGTDAAIWNRLKLIPFTVTIPKPEIDKDMLEKLKREGPGILRWAVEGCLEWQHCGLMEPLDVTESGHEWREESDPFQGFFEARCELGPTATCTATALWAAAQAYADTQGFELKQNPFVERLEQLGCVRSRTNSTRYWRGIKLKGVTPVTPNDGGFNK